MRLARLISCLLSLGVSAGALSAQIPTRRQPSQSATVNALRLLVGNPFSYSAEDSSHSLAIAEGLRSRIDKLAGNDFRVLSRTDMNNALTQFSYPVDAILGPLPLRNLAQSLNAKILVTTSFSHDGKGGHIVTSRLAGLNDDAGNVVVQPEGELKDHAALGTKIGDGFAPVLKSWTDAKACVDQSKSAPDKAIQSAKKALAVLPTSGLANYCLGQLAIARGKKADSAEAMQYFTTATKGDPLSLPAWTQLASGFEVAGDTAHTIDALKQMLLIAPTNQPLRELAFKKFLAYGHPETAEQVADDGLKLDPGNTGLFELRANARIFRENYAGALDDLEQIIALDSSLADTTFYFKYMATAGVQPDTARLVKFASIAVKKFPDNVSVLKQVAASYSQVGASDSLLGAITALLPFDSAGAVGYALQEAKGRLDAKNSPAAQPFIDFASKHGDAAAKEGAAGLLLNATLPYLQPATQNFDSAASGLRRVVAMANPQGRYAPIANHFLGLSLVNLISKADKEAETAKSCDGARSVEAMTTEADSAFVLAAPYADQKGPRDQMIAYLTGMKPHTASMIRVYCK
jgi:tetratricopeptide (TPR) repeat protein